MSTAPDPFVAARAVADAVLYEGYVLYPYRASAQKNQLRWQFGVLVPPAWAAADASERSAMRTEVVIDPGGDATLTVRVRCLQVQHRQIESASPAGDAFEPVDELEVDGTRWVPWDEAVEHEIDLEPMALLPVGGEPRSHPVTLPPSQTTELLTDASGAVVGRAVRRCRPVDGIVRVTRVGRRALGAGQGDGRGEQHQPTGRPMTPTGTPWWPTRWSPCTRCWRSTTAPSSPCSIRRPWRSRPSPGAATTAPSRS